MLFSVLPIALSIGGLLAHLLLLHYFSNRSTLFFFFFLSVFSFIISPSISVYKSVLGFDFSKSAKEHGLKINATIVLHEDQDVRTKPFGSATISGAVLTDPNEFQRLLHGVNLNHGPGSVFIVMEAVVIKKDNLSIPPPYEFHRNLMDAVPEIFGDVSNIVSTSGINLS